MLISFLCFVLLNYTYSKNSAALIINWYSEYKLPTLQKITRVVFTVRFLFFHTGFNMHLFFYVNINLFKVAEGPFVHGKGTNPLWKVTGPSQG